MIKRILIHLSIFIVGAMGYGAIEVLWRGRTHFSMLLLGGLCFSFMFRLALHTKINIFLKALISALFITASEFLAGCIVNLWLDLRVWDYSTYSFDLLGQICPLYSVLWFLLSLAVMTVLWMGQVLLRRLLSRRRPDIPASPPTKS